jgi:hypothetical protein
VRDTCNRRQSGMPTALVNWVGQLGWWTESSWQRVKSEQSGQGVGPAHADMMQCCYQPHS